MDPQNNIGPVKRSYPEEVYLNGDWMPSREAFISVFDRGFMFGDGVYEVTPFYKGKPFRLKDHLDRLNYSLSQIDIELEVSSLEQIMFDAVSRGNFSEEDCAVYIEVTRGVAPRTHFFPEDVPPTILIYAFPVQLEGFEEKQASVMVSEDLRWHRCDIKSISLMANIKANTRAHRLGLNENILVRNGYFTEGSHSSIFFIENKTVFTHPEGSHILSGITRTIIIEICKDLGLKVIEEPVHFDELVEVDEVFLTGTTTQVLAVKAMRTAEEEVFRKDERGEITQQIQQAFIKMTRNLS